jgi:aryl sulfotransferase
VPPRPCKPGIVTAKFGFVRVYRSFIDDSARWEGFEYRADDIVVCAPTKSGTTWMQTCCAVLVFGSPEAFPGRLGDFSPWLDMQLRSKEEVFARYEAQQHRRIIKTHTPLDGLPLDDRVMYIDVGRDPRDVALSMAEHFENMDMTRAVTLREAAVGMGDLAGQLGPDPLPSESAERLWAILTDDSPTPRSAANLRAVLNHHRQAWTRRHHANVALFHYVDLRRDLLGQMRRLADLIGIEVDESRFDSQVAAVGFAAMKSRALHNAPETDLNVWADPAEFFKRARIGGWRGLLSEDRLEEYDRRVSDLVDADLAEWIHDGSSPGTIPPG